MTGSDDFARPGLPGPAPRAARLPRWRGFNLLEKFTVDRSAPFREEDFRLIAEWGFDFARLPMDYRTWTDEQDLYRFKESVLAEIDQAVEWGERYGIHICLCLHRAPGYCVNRPLEPMDLWTNRQAQDACAYQWAHFARRYREIPSARLSFNLLNEPKQIDEATYIGVASRLVSAIRTEDPDRLVIADGLDLAWTPVTGLADLGIAQSLHAYDPWRVSHYKAPWFPGAVEWPAPTWPLTTDGDVRNKARLRSERIRPWKALEGMGVGIHVGEFGTYNETPHAVTLAWMRDFLELFEELGWGWALWNLRGSYGPMDSRRRDVAYEQFGDHQLDREMLNLLHDH